MAKTPAWTRKEGKNPKGGLNAKGRESYTKGTLKAPSKVVGNKRRASFCARMSGMKKKLTSAKTARDPNSRINKSLRAWNCQKEHMDDLLLINKLQKKKRHKNDIKSRQ